MATGQRRDAARFSVFFQYLNFVNEVAEHELLTDIYHRFVNFLATCLTVCDSDREDGVLSTAILPGRTVSMQIEDPC